MARKNADANLYTTTDGRKIKVKKVDALFIQSVQNSVTMPEKPTYETRTGAGKVEKRRMDKLSAEQTPGGIEIWEQYQKDLAEATSLQMERSMKAILLDGTVRPEGEFVTTAWQKRMRIIGIELPEDLDELWVMYLSTSLSAEDLLGLSGAIMRLTGVAEEVIQQAEGTFHDPVHADTGRSDVEDTRTDS